MTQLFAYLFFIIGLLLVMLGGLGLGAYWGLSSFDEVNLDLRFTEKEYVFYTSALIVVGLVLVGCALGLEG
ncbi:MAG: hypothetical protein GX151_12625 [Gammaproteobacteria bacterium]|jgi:hypothetical protein|nr:hypothetical protein [Gammaproteobacteria bacterium]